jgi:hypothetical protein
LDRMIPTTIEEEIGAYLGCSSKPYLITPFDGLKDSGCVYWDLPPQEDEDKPITIRYQELMTRIVQLINEDENDPEVDALVKKINELLNGVPVTRKFGFSFVSDNDILRLDKTKGIRKEWWELHSRYSTQGVCVFQGYRSAQALASRIADILIVMPGEDQYDFLRFNQTRGNNRPVDTDQIILALRKLDAEFGISIIYATMDSVEFLFNRPVEGESRAKIRRRLSRLCPSAEDLAGSIRLGRVTLWWD